MRLLFITSTRIGDAVLSSGLLGALLERHRDARVTVAAGRSALPLFREVPGIERLIPIDKRSFAGHWIGLWRQVLPHRWNLVVDLRASAIAYLLWAGQRVVMLRRSSQLHRVEELGQLIGTAEPPAPRVWLGATDLNEAVGLIPDGAPVLALGPAANWAGKQWRAERFAELAQRLTAPDGLLPDARLAVFAAADERNQIGQVLDALPAERTLDLIGRPDLLTVAACLQRSALYIGNDSGLMHLAAAAGTPTLGLFGPSHAWRYRPWGSHCAFVRTLESYETLTTGPGYDRRTTDSLMDGLSVDAVIDAATELWQERAVASA